MGNVLKKRQIVISTLVLALGLAIFLNWYFAGSGAQLKATGVVNTSKNLGDAQYVNAITSSQLNEEKAVINTSNNENISDNEQTKEYFAEVRLKRQVARDKSLEVLKNIIENSNLSDNDKVSAVSEMAIISKEIKEENNIENILIGKGFDDCIVIVEKDNVQVIVKSKKLEESQILQIKELVLKQTEVDVENISIIESK